MSKLETATFAAGCFWNVEVEFRNVDGVKDVNVGYTGGQAEHPTYEQVCGGGTGHAEAVHVTFDPNEVTYDALLKVFWNLHDPTTANRQGPDVGEQYRSAIFVHSNSQRETAESSKSARQQELAQPIVTEITEAAAFWPAEDYHQRYLEKRGFGQL